MSFKNFFENLSLTTNQYPWLLVAWLIYGAVLGIAGIFVGGHLPFFLLGAVFGLMGGLVHLAVVALQKKPYFWIAGCLIAALAFAFTVLSAPSQIWFYTLAAYFVCGSLYYFILEKLFLRSRS